jgi:hypothetical protein
MRGSKFRDIAKLRATTLPFDPLTLTLSRREREQSNTGGVT